MRKTKLRRFASTTPHPLESIVLDVLAKRKVVDRALLAPYLSGVTFISDGVRTAYLKVAEDVLGYMLSQGKLKLDADGWYVLP